MVGTKNTPPSWLSAAAKRVDLEGNVDAMFKDDNDISSSCSSSSETSPPLPKGLSDVHLGFGERALSAAGAAFISAVIVNPLDVVKTRLQAQAAGVPYQNQCGAACFESNSAPPDLKYPKSFSRAVLNGESVCSQECSQYKGTLDVFYKVIRQEGFSRLWRGTNASLALALPSVGIYLPTYDIFRNYMEDYTNQSAPRLTPYVPLLAGAMARSLACISCYPVELARTRMQAFTETQVGVKPPGVWKTLSGVLFPIRRANNVQNFKNYRILWTGLGAQLARDVPFSAICWATLEPMRRGCINLLGDEAAAVGILGANFSAGFVAGSLASAVTCPLDVARTRRQIEKNPARQMGMTTRETILEIWRGGGWKGLFTGVGPEFVVLGLPSGLSFHFMKLSSMVCNVATQLLDNLRALISC